jgi:murein DD-endopeptidase MepM/ murein hydrolase activator NlpD
MLPPPPGQPVRPAVFIAVVAIGILAGLALYLYAPLLATRPHSLRLETYLQDPAAHADWQMRAGTRCGRAPFILPTDGYLGFGYGDAWKVGQRHQGFDIFGPVLLVGQTPVLAAYAGYLTRLPDWKSTVIIRVPRDPLEPSRQIWVYYTHMATPEGASFVSAEFPPGTAEKYVEAGTLLGHQGNYSGDAGNPTGIHLHFSIVRDDGTGHFTNELNFDNTFDPSPYLGLRGNARDDWSKPVVCPPP